MPFYISILSFCLLICSCTSPDKPLVRDRELLETDSSYCWQLVLEEANFRKSYNFQMFTHRDTLYVMHPDGAYASGDGNKWTKTGLTDIIGNQAFLDYIYFNNAIYALGKFEGNIEKYQMHSQIARSEDFKAWEILTKKSNLPKRFFYHPFVFQNKIWIIGGSDEHIKYADVWNSSDGIVWNKVADSTNLGRHDGSYFLHFKDKLFKLAEDVWTSSDGIHWTQICDTIAANIYGYAPLIYDGQIWLIGCSRSGKFQSEVLHSKDGKIWFQQKTEWSPRGGAAVCVFNDKVFMTGGKYGGQDPNNPYETEFIYSNDIWCMKKQSAR